MLASGSVTCLLGPNGVGKTTLIRTLMGLIPALAGRVLIGGDDVAGLSRAAVAHRVAYVPQGYAGDFAYTVLDLVVMGRTAHLGAFAGPGRGDVGSPRYWPFVQRVIPSVVEMRGKSRTTVW